MTSMDWVTAFITPTTDQRQGTVSPTTTTFQNSTSHPALLIPSSPSPVSKVEAMFYYSGLLSSPRLVYHMETMPWTKPTGREAYCWLKELCPIFNHRLNLIWGDLGPQVCMTQPVLVCDCSFSFYLFFYNNNHFLEYLEPFMGHYLSSSSLSLFNHGEGNVDY